jgi:hypothetical protein
VDTWDAREGVTDDASLRGRPLAGFSMSLSNSAALHDLSCSTNLFLLFTFLIEMKEKKKSNVSPWRESGAQPRNSWRPAFLALYHIFRFLGFCWTRERTRKNRINSNPPPRDCPSSHALGSRSPSNRWAPKDLPNAKTAWSRPSLDPRERVLLAN